MNFLKVYLLVINILSLMAMFIDKQKARKHKFRISEKNLFLLSLLGGSLGVFIGMHVFHHKTKHLKFILGIPIILILQILLLNFFFKI